MKYTHFGGTGPPHFKYHGMFPTLRQAPTGSQQIQGYIGKKKKMRTRWMMTFIAKIYLNERVLLKQHKRKKDKGSVDKHHIPH